MDDDEDDDSPAPLAGAPLASAKIYMTPEGHAALQSTLAALKHDRHRTVEIVAWAASNGDRSENADYKEGKRRLREIDRKLRFITRRLAAAEIVDPAAQTDRTRVYFGATVTYLTETDETRTVRIVGVDEADLSRGTVSIASPIARALLRAGVGDEVRVPTPSGPATIEIVAIAYSGADPN